jgi:hypothetical protein
MLNIKLNRHELMLCDIFGTVRRKNAMQFNYDRQVSKQDKYDMDIDGFKGEYIVAQYLNVMPDFSINEKKNPIDLHWNNKSIDVKSTRNPNGNIYITEYHKKKPCDYYVQVILNDDGGDIVGWIDSENLFKKATFVNGSHPSYMLKQKDLFKLPIT